MKFLNNNNDMHQHHSAYFHILVGALWATAALMGCGNGTTPGGTGPDTTKQGKWTEITSIPTSLLAGVFYTVSSESKKIIVGVRDDKFYISSDYGKNWDTRSPPKAATVTGNSITNAIASSADGVNLAVAFSPGHVYTSVNSGESWSDPSEVEGAASAIYNWGGVTSSADGTRLVAFVGSYSTGGHIYTSIDSGKKWKDSSPASGDGSGNLNWTQVSCSADCKIIAAVTQQGNSGTVTTTSQVLISDDFGFSWHNRSPASKDSDHNYAWNSIASSSDGKKIVTAGIFSTTGSQLVGIKVYTSTNSGKDWMERILPIKLNAEDFSAAGSYAVSSADGSRIAILVQLYTKSGLQTHVYTSSNFGDSWTEQILPSHSSSGSVALFYAPVSSGDGSLITFLRSEYPSSSNVGGTPTKTSLFTLTFP